MFNHLAVIPDGNGRWALKRGISRIEGHKEGAKRLIPLIKKVQECAIPYLSFYALSSENMSRDKEEVAALQNTIIQYLEEIILPFSLQNNIRLRFIGSRDRIIRELREAMERAEWATSRQDKLNLVFAIDYSGRDEIAGALSRCKGKDKDTFTYQDIQQYLYTADMPDPDVVLRYGGYARLSNFMPLQSVYSELMFNPAYWPDFKPEDIDKVIQKYKKIKRNFGKV